MYKMQYRNFFLHLTIRCDETIHIHIYHAALDDFLCHGTRVSSLQGTATTVLNVRSGPGISYARVGQLSRGQEVNVIQKSSNNWVQIEFGSQRGYAYSKYLKFSPLPQKANSPPAKSSSGSSSWSFWSIVWNIITWGLGIYLGLVVLYWLLKILIISYFIVSASLTFTFRLLSLPFFFLNALQRYLAKPWFIFFKKNRFSNATNENLRFIFYFLQFPFYVLLFPLRIVNAVFFNLLVHCSFEMFNYVMEVILPSEDKEGHDDFIRWILFLPYRIIKYVVWHGSLIIIESAIWTVIEVFLPTLTLFHGTSNDAAESIVACPNRGSYRGRDVGIWRVGGGNYAGNGIYFAPARSTARHYSAGAIIVCRVTLGSTLDLGMAPYHVYYQCGKPNALEATRWGLENNYVTGEWWRPDEGWWEYCMYDWQNRYNYSWRIRPLYVIDLDSGYIQRIPGGMCHWLSGNGHHGLAKFHARRLKKCGKRLVYRSPHFHIVYSAAFRMERMSCSFSGANVPGASSPSFTAM